MDGYGKEELDFLHESLLNEQARLARVKFMKLKDYLIDHKIPDDTILVGIDMLLETVADTEMLLRGPSDRWEKLKKIHNLIMEVKNEEGE
jgi:hypothetical protein